MTYVIQYYNIASVEQKIFYTWKTSYPQFRAEWATSGYGVIIAASAAGLRLPTTSKGTFEAADTMAMILGTLELYKEYDTIASLRS